MDQPKVVVHHHHHLRPQYGSVQFANPVIKAPSPFLHGTRRSMNSHAIVMMVLLPWLLFFVVYVTCATIYRYNRPELCNNIYDVAIVVVIVTWLLAARSWKRKIRNDPYRQPSWLLYAAISLTIALLAGTAVGDMNFAYHTQPAHAIEDLNVYGNQTGIDPSFTKGEEIFDAGRIYFAEGSRLDLNMSMTFKNLDLFCVAPITKGDKPLRSYDYWAVGTNCCSANGRQGGHSTSKFACGEFANPHAKAGLRLMRDDQRAFYRLAVQQAETSYGIRSEHPIFLEWMQDPTSLVLSWHEHAYRWHEMSILGYFVFNAFCVTCMVVFFSKLGRY
jgi:hypothetical protein